jgi:hypothetical protein
MSTFLPPGYKPPDKSGKYMKFQQGETRFRVLSDAPLIGNVGWKDKKPIRRPVGASWQIGEVDERNGVPRISHFWAVAVWDYSTSRVRVLEFTQSTVQTPISELSKKPKWGHPSKYDIVVTRTGTTMEDTEYVVTPEPPEPPDPIIVEAWDKLKDRFDLSRLFSNGDPFGDEVAVAPPDDSDGPF